MLVTRASRRLTIPRLALIAIAIVLGVSMVSAQVQTITIVDTVICCCGMHEHCPCLEHQHQHRSQPGDAPMVRGCARGRTLLSTPSLTAFNVPEVALAIPAVPAIASVIALPTPHLEPEPRQPRGPS